MDALLRRGVRDHNRGNWHPASEHVEVFGRIRRADFDARAMTRVRFSDGSEALLFEDELGQGLSAGDLPKA